MSDLIKKVRRLNDSESGFSGALSKCTKLALSAFLHEKREIGIGNRCQPNQFSMQIRICHAYITLKSMLLATKSRLK